MKKQWDKMTTPINKLSYEIQKGKGARMDER